MLKRPSSSDSEADLLRAQECFLAAGVPSAVRVLRRPEKRRGEPSGCAGEEKAEEEEEVMVSCRDVVTITEHSEQIPSLTPGPSKKSCFRAEQVCFVDEDPEAELERKDTHVTAVLSRIIEHDTSAVPVSFPAFTGAAFPKVFHRSEVEDQGITVAQKCRKSIFAQKIAAQKIAAQRARGKGLTGGDPVQPTLVPQGTSCAPLASMETASLPSGSEEHAVSETSRLVTGLGLSGHNGSLEAKKIHEENEAKLHGMSQSEILEEQRRLLSQLEPRLVDFVKSRKPHGGCQPSAAPLPAKEEQQHCFSEHISQEVEMEDVEANVAPAPPITEDELPVKPEKGWLHMDKLEPEKLEWMRDLPASRKRSTKKAMQARFNFDGVLISPTEDLPTHLGLHHHGDEPELAGYSLQELFLLSRSQVTQQRCLALTTLGHILTKARASDFASSVRGSVFATLLDAGLLFLLRFSLDDKYEGLMAAAVQALRALLVTVDDEECLDNTFSWFLGMATFPLLPFAQEEDKEDDEGLEDALKETAKEKEEKKSDHDVARNDVIKGLLRMKLLPRLRYILEVLRPPPRTVLDILEILIRIARHSPTSAIQVLDCPRLMNTVMSEFLPCSWSPPVSPTPDRLHGFPVAAAMKLVRILATAGRHTCARLLNSLGARERISCFVAQEPQDLLLEPGEALRISTEALRLWAVAAGYGQACDLYRDLYPILVQTLQSHPMRWPPGHVLRPLELQRVQALHTLLTNVTHTAGCHQELQASLTSPQETECPPPPSVEWGHVTGLQPPLLASLKACVKLLDEPGQKENILSLLPSHLLYLGAFYSQLSAQSSFQPVDCLQELEVLTSEVLIPLLSHQAICDLIGNLKSCSALCNPLSCSDPEMVPSLPSLTWSGGKPALSLSGSNSPFPFLIALCYLLEVLSSIHKGIAHKFSHLLLSSALMMYLQACCQAMPTVSLFSAWPLWHEQHLLYLLVKLALRLVPVSSEVEKQISLYHRVAATMVPWLLPGSEYLARDLLSTVIFNLDLITEGRCGGPEAADLSELQLQEGGSFGHFPVGPLMRDACAQLPSIRGCYLTHLASLEPTILYSRDRHLMRTPWVRSWMLPEVQGPILPSDWPFLPIISLYERVGIPGGGDMQVEALPQASVKSVVHSLQWLLILERWRDGVLQAVTPAAKLARLSCLFLCSSDLFLERPVQQLTWALLRSLCVPARLAALDLGVPLPGLASFHDLYASLLSQFEAVSFGDHLFCCFVLLPLQQRFSVSLRLALFGEHVGLLRSLGLPLQQLPVPLEQFTYPPEDSLTLLRLYFQVLVTGALRCAWCPVLYVVALAHLNAFIFSQDVVSQEVDAARRSMLRKTYYLTDEVLKDHLLLFKVPHLQKELGFDAYEHLPPIRARRLESVVGMEEGESLKT
ncbi:RNA polymerase II-associated protein 1 isoform X1 [Scleropages formosus]|uniref:RNA polymerase II associated protein 1 n=1 Tax=Scleropages formosus TaxID=113540 RepID=A0A8C9S5C4_SCLFO|nr:RNA polymerase II-associated protein 1 isoform X1 [Scleropages formosus]XP_018583221.2 RNA polymerase II-associated protein 1 isoform X1 [Scleropages formosus]XP_018583223.2 RNA polymerase II-associated protein 1 isoform X1 [Scleropages formosus]XP_018583224.2 RNA polymerase II-associated protein 1 isoform X1 [Scleropages formosus]